MAQTVERFSSLRRLFSAEDGLSGHLWPRWLFLRALGLIYISAFFSLLFQVRGLVGPHGILPAGEYLAAVASATGSHRVFYAPTLLWASSSSVMLQAICWTGMLSGVIATSNLAPRAAFLTCYACYLSFVAAAGDFAGYQSDGMLLEAGFLALFLAPRLLVKGGLRPGLGAGSPPCRAGYFLLLFEWFRIYFESGLAKMLSGDLEWRHLTAMVDYYQNGPLPTWIGWYVAHLPFWFHKGTAFATLALELGLVWMVLLPRRWRLLCFLIATPWEVGVILTANYTFLNYLVLALGLLLLDDQAVHSFLPWTRRPFLPPQPMQDPVRLPATSLKKQMSAIGLALSTVLLSLVAYANTLLLLRMLLPSLPLPLAPVTLLEPFRIANQYGLFAVMTKGRYEIEFQGSDDGQTWKAYGYRYKPQALDERPRIYAPYQPRFDWNLWFASLTSWRNAQIVPRTEEALLNNDPDVLSLFRSNPFAGHAPRLVRAVLWQYWFTSMAEKQTTGNWWRRTLLGTYAPTVERLPDGRIRATSMPTLDGAAE